MIDPDNQEAQNRIIRLRQVIAHYALGNQSEFARSLGKRQSVVSSWFQRWAFNASLILARYPEIDANWLLHGDGDMLKSNNQPDDTHTATSDTTTSPDVAALIDALAKQQALTEMALKQNEMLIELLQNSKNKES